MRSVEFEIDPSPLTTEVQYKVENTTHERLIKQDITRHKYILIGFPFLF